MDFISHTKKTRFADYKTALEGNRYLGYAEDKTVVLCHTL
jgi:hypothetical protein